MTDEEKADALLYLWWKYDKRYTLPLGFDSVVAYCRHSVTSRQYETAEEILNDRDYRETMDKVGYCMNCISVEASSVIGLAMKNRQAGATTWRHGSGMSYREARNIVIPFLREKCLL